MDLTTHKGFNFTLNALDKTQFVEKYQIWANDDEVTSHTFQGTYPVSKSDAESVYSSMCSPNNVCFGIYTPELIGTCGIYEIHWPSRIGEFRILIGDKTVWNKGIGKACLKTMISLAFQRYNLYKLWLGFNSANAAAQKAYSETGMSYECTIQQGHYKNGKYNDLVRMCIFKK